MKRFYAQLILSATLIIMNLSARELMKDFIKGIALNNIPQMENTVFQGKSFKYHDEDGTVISGFELFKKYGVNYARLGLMHTPLDTVKLALSNVLLKARECYKYDLKIELKIFVSVVWANTGNQWIPIAWAGESHVETVAAARY